LPLKKSTFAVGLDGEGKAFRRDGLLAEAGLFAAEERSRDEPQLETSWTGLNGS